MTDTSSIHKPDVPLQSGQKWVNKNELLVTFLHNFFFLNVSNFTFILMPTLLRELLCTYFLVEIYDN